MILVSALGQVMLYILFHPSLRPSAPCAKIDLGGVLPVPLSLVSAPRWCVDVCVFKGNRSSIDIIIVPENGLKRLSPSCTRTSLTVRLVIAKKWKELKCKCIMIFTQHKVLYWDT